MMMTMTDAQAAVVGADLAGFVRAFHQRTKHRFGGYANGPETLDWDAQPAPFRHFDGAPRIALPLATDDDLDITGRLALPLSALDAPLPALPLSLRTLGALLHLSLGLTAWKSTGPDRWAVRANPSSGNLHPAEAYVVLSGVEGVPDGLHHYLPDSHELECRARHDDGTRAAGARLHVGLSSVMWRETWKYGERAFRYCQLDAGHAVACLRYAAALLGWSVREHAALPSAALAALLGVDRAQDFPARRVADTELEEAELLLAVTCDGDAPDAPAPAGIEWLGVASPIDPHPMYRWPVLAEVADATRSTGRRVTPDMPAPFAAARAHDRPVGDILLGRRSAQRFDPHHVMARDEFGQLLARLMPVAAAPWDALPDTFRIDLVLFVHRVEGVAPGVYLLVRGAPERGVTARLADRFALTPVRGLPPRVDLRLLSEMPPPALARLARSVHCHQDIASNACFALGMLCDFDAALAGAPAGYRALHRQCGLMGQVLYLEAEALGLRGTGIGCFFDDAVHELLGLEDTATQTLYHFTVGRAVDDARIESSPAYAQRAPAEQGWSR
jgi:SagB-type dehydrogenase family enzyme